MVSFEQLKELRESDWKDIFNKHLKWSKDNNRIAGNPQWWNKTNALNVVGVRFNTEIDFNRNKYDDFLMLDLEDAFLSYFEVTTDPYRNKYGIAHLRQGCWNSYIIRPHRWETKWFPGIGKIPRWAICQDKDEIEIVRTDGNGKIVDVERGYFGINIHESSGDTSLGCTILKNQQSYLDYFLPAIYDLRNKKRIPFNWNDLTYTLINYKQLESYL